MISRRSWHGDSAPPRTSEAGCSFGAKPVFLRLGKPKPLAFMRHMLFDFCLTTCGLHGSWKSWMFKQTIYLYVYIYIYVYINYIIESKTDVCLLHILACGGFFRKLFQADGPASSPRRVASTTKASTSWRGSTKALMPSLTCTLAARSVRSSTNHLSDSQQVLKKWIPSYPILDRERVRRQNMTSKIYE